VSDIVSWFCTPQLNFETKAVNSPEYDLESELAEEHTAPDEWQQGPSRMVRNKTYWILFNRCVKRIGHTLGSSQ
jgi:hypothetical protein